MKKTLIMVCVVLWAVVAACLAGCSAETTPQQSAAQTDAQQTIPSAKALVVYFSCTGHTEAVANNIQSLTGADVFRIVPQTPYTEEDLDYHNDKSRANREQNDETARPAFEGSIEGWQDYEVVYVGYPLWWGTMPRILNTFFDAYDFEGKTLIPFCTSGSSGIEFSLQAIRALEPGAVLGEGRRFSADASEEEIRQWLIDMGQMPSAQAAEPGKQRHIHLQTEGQTWTAALANNASAEALYALLQQGDLILLMEDYGGFEKVGTLDCKLPTCDEQITTEPGDLILYQGQQLALYYDTNTWDFTRLGKIENTSKQALLETLGQGSVTVTLSLAAPAS